MKNGYQDINASGRKFKTILINFHFFHSCCPQASIRASKSTSLSHVSYPSSLSRSVSISSLYCFENQITSIDQNRIVSLLILLILVIRVFVSFVILFLCFFTGLCSLFPMVLWRLRSHIHLFPFTSLYSLFPMVLCRLLFPHLFVSSNRFMFLVSFLGYCSHIYLFPSTGLRSLRDDCFCQLDVLLARP